jgi:hypothetical protein
MYEQANVKLSKEESELVQNREWILTKHAVIGKVVLLFGQLSEEFKLMMQDAGLNEVMLPEPKISKGEQYEKLPYVMLDFPRIFDKENVFAVRCFFWWGNFFSINLQVSGKFQEKYFSSVDDLAKFNDWMFCVNEDVWKHDFSTDNFLPFNAINANEHLNRNFIKTAKKIPLSEWNNAYSFYKKSFSDIISNLAS